MSIWTEAPEVRCPKCAIRFDHGAHWELSLDHELECPACGAKIILCKEEALRRWSWRAAPEPSAAPPKEES